MLVTWVCLVHGNSYSYELCTFLHTHTYTNIHTKGTHGQEDVRKDVGKNVSSVFIWRGGSNMTLPSCSLFVCIDRYNHIKENTI